MKAMKNKIIPVKKLTALALTQPQNTLPIGDYTNIIRFDRTFNVVLRWMESYQMVIDANKNQIN